jgi:hypothetical protein
MVFLVDLGEIPNWGALVDDLRWGLVYRVHNYLAEQAGAAIYRLHQRWRPISRRRAGGRRGRRLLARVKPWLSPWQGHRRWTTYSSSLLRRVNVLRHVAHGRQAINAGEDHFGRSQPKWVRQTHRRSGPSLSSAKVFTPPWLSPHQRARIAAMAQITAQRSPVARGAELVILFSHCTMVVTIRASDRPFYRARITNFHVMTC